jgi:hypothetical protein
MPADGLKREMQLVFLVFKAWIRGSVRISNLAFEGIAESVFRLLMRLVRGKTRGY